MDSIDIKCESVNHLLADLGSKELSRRVFDDEDQGGSVETAK